jgi:hydrogenase maturation protein HypF
MQLSAESSSNIRVKVDVKGVVQGVGFRPFVYQLATRFALNGFVQNSGTGVRIELEGSSDIIEEFLSDLQLKQPPLARIDNIYSERLPTIGSTHFEIIHSSSTAISTMLSADISLCKDCLEEMNDKNNRRFKYPFINCTNCGPRYSIINNLPYDRAKSSMHPFLMCDACKEEYTNPSDRRYHAQAISCYECGPKLKYISLYGEEISDEKAAIAKICSLIREGEVVAIKGIGGFHIVCDATNSSAIKSLRENKHRPSKPLAVMFKNIRAIKKVATLSKKDEQLILSKERPIVVVTKKENGHLSELIAPNIDRVGVFLPYTPLHEILLSALNFPIVATSANLSGEPIILNEEEIFRKMPLVVEHLLTHDREIVNACDDSVAQNCLDDSIMLRMARGYAPYSFYLQKKSPKKILALGGNQKVTISLAFDNNIVVSPHIADLSSIESHSYFLRVIKTLKRVYDFEPDIIVCDQHPKYETSHYAKEYVAQNSHVSLIEVQHHYAHALSCMAEYALDEDVLAFCFDGTGYGDDGVLWGGEVFVANRDSYKRVYHFEELSLLGGEVAIKEPSRIGVSLLFKLYSFEEIQTMSTPLLDSITKSELKTLYLMYERGINSPKSSSVGRLFDGVYALCGFTKPLGYEGESGLILESLSAKNRTKATYSYSLEDGVIEYKKMISQIMNESSCEKIAKKFINTLVKIIVEIAQKYPTLPIVLSGGVFQNKVLVSQVTKELQKIQRKYYLQSKIAINDGGLSLGQLYYALNKNKG